MPASNVQVRPAAHADAETIAGLAGDLAQSFTLVRSSFDPNFTALLADDDACVLVAGHDGEPLGYLLGLRHLTFYANGPVAVVEEILVRDAHRGLGVGRALVEAFESWARERHCTLVSLSTRRAASFYLAIGYEESARYFRKLL